MKFLCLTLIALVGTATANYGGSTQGGQAGPAAQFENWVTDKFRRLTHMTSAKSKFFAFRDLGSTGGAIGGATGGATGGAEPFTPTCGETTEGGGAFASCTSQRVYDSTKASASSPDDTSCCKDVPLFVATCGEITDGGGAFASCIDARVYDSTKAAVTSPDDAKCCKAKPPAMSKCIGTGHDALVDDCACIVVGETDETKSISCAKGKYCWRTTTLQACEDTKYPCQLGSSTYCGPKDTTEQYRADFEGSCTSCTTGPKNCQEMIDNMIAPKMCHNKCASGWKNDVFENVMSHYKCSPEQEKKALNMIENDDGSGEGALSGGKRLTGGVRAFVLGAVVAVMMTSNFF